MRALRWQPRIAWAIATIGLLALGGVLFLGMHRSDGDGGVKNRPLSAQEREAKRIERRLARAPGDRGLQLEAVEAWVEAGGQRLSDVDVTTEPIPGAVRVDFEAGLRIWDRYLTQTGGDAGAEIANSAGEVSFALAEIGSRDPADIEADIARAARALQIAGRRQPTLYMLSNVAVYSYFDGEYARGDVAARGAAATFRQRSRRRIVFEQLDSSREHAEVFRRLLAHANAELDESGDDLLEEPLRAYSGAVGLNKEEPTAPSTS
jgi:hypothetical protein